MAYLGVLDMLERFLCQESTVLLRNLLILNRSMTQHPVVTRLLLSRAAVAANTYRRRWVLSQANLATARGDISARDRLIGQLYQQLREAWAWMLRTLSAAQIIDASTEVFHQQATWIPPEEIMWRPTMARDVEMTDQPEEDV